MLSGIGEMCPCQARRPPCRRVTVENLIGAWSALDTRRRIVLVATSLAVAASVFFLSKMAAAPRMELLYAGLEGPAAGEVVQALEAQGVAYDVRGGAIFVDATQRDALRMRLASDGLPANGAVGYEILDDLSGFGTTSQMFDAAYWRAKEGELARTIMASPAVRAARVHISTPSAQVCRQQSAPSASVFVTPAGGALPAGHGKALRYLVASAVSGLQPEQVSIIDATSGALLMEEAETSPAAGATTRAETMRRGVERLLEARVGLGKAVVELSLETVTDRESIVERRVDPDSRVAISSETEERTAQAQGQAGGAVTVASNLPDGDAGGGESSSQNAETREIVNYEVSETQRELLREPGAIRRLTVAVLVDGTREIDGSGAEVFVPRTAEELSDLRELVASAVGFDEARGDIITIKSLPFQPLAEAGTPPPAVAFGGLDMMQLIQVGVLAAVALALGLFVVRPLLTRAPPPPALPPALREAEGEAGLPVPAGQGASGRTDSEALDGEIDLGDFGGGMGTVSDFDLDDDLPGLGGSADPVARLKSLISERQDETVEILRSWMEDERERT